MEVERAWLGAERPNAVRDEGVEVGAGAEAGVKKLDEADRAALAKSELAGAPLSLQAGEGAANEGAVDEGEEGRIGGEQQSEGEGEGDGPQAQGHRGQDGRGFYDSEGKP